MSARCQLTEKKPGYGNKVSHSHQKSRRRWMPNIQQRRYWLPSEGRWVRLRLSAKAVKTVDKRGVESVVAEMRARGERI